jgi:hypothetical protein
MRAALLTCLVSISFLLCQSSNAKSQLDSATLNQLTMLEQKFFGHSFAAESDDDRTQRIEKLIFGTPAEGAAADRIKKLASVTYLDTRPEPVSSPQTAQSVPTEPSQPMRREAAKTTPSMAAQPTSTTRGTSEPNSNPSVASEPMIEDAPPIINKSGFDDYPHVTALEKEILGSTFVGQVLSARIVRMETKAFGNASKSTDLGERTDNLEQYAEQKLHKKPFLADEVADSGDDDAMGGQPGSQSQSPTQSRPQSDYPHVTALETAILGQPAPDQPLEKRLSAMEVKAFGGVSKSVALSDRTDALEKYAEKTLHKKPFLQEEDTETADAGPGGQAKAPVGRGKKLLSMVGSSLLGMAGVNGMASGAGGGLAGAPGTGIGPMGGFGGPGGFSGIRVRKRPAAPQEDSAADVPTGPVEDPMVRAKDPPPASARLAIRVGWCELNVFGKTYPNMHLAERLTQLNRELNFAPGKSAIDLMDGVGSLVKAAQAYKASPVSGPAIGSAPHPPVR